MLIITKTVSNQELIFQVGFSVASSISSTYSSCVNCVLNKQDNAVKKKVSSNVDADLHIHRCRASLLLNTNFN